MKQLNFILPNQPRTVQVKREPNMLSLMRWGKHCSPQRLPLWFLLSPLAVLFSFFLFSTPLYANTVIIEPGNADGTGGVYGDDFIRGQLNGGADVTINTNYATGSSPNDIYIQPGSSSLGRLATR